MHRQPAIGIDDFRKLRELGLAWVDKSHLICDLFDRTSAEVVLLPRPRRFGKTLNLSMLRCFFERRPDGADLSGLFEDLAVWKAGTRYREHFQRYPVIHLSLKETKHDRFEDCLDSIRLKIAAVFREHRELLDGGGLDPSEKAGFHSILDGTATRAAYERSLLDLSSWLHRLHGERVFILIDEYDEPIHAGYLGGYTAEIVGFCRNFLSAGLKSNPHLARAVITGILRVARESIFWGLNNVGVFSLLRSEFNTCFGFTEPEVEALLTQTGRAERLPVLRAWYNGYLFGGEVIYNPWSVLNYIANPEAEPEPYWIATSSNDLVRSLLEERALSIQGVFETLLTGGAIERVIEENVALGELSTSEDALWSLLVFTGYLRAERRSHGPDERPAHLLAIPNREVREVYTSTFRKWLEGQLRPKGGNLESLLVAVIGGDAIGVEQQLSAFVENILSYHDVPSSSPERVYQAFLVGLLSALEGRLYRVRPNREAGTGRADILIEPRKAGQPGVVMELKVVSAPRLRPTRALNAGIAQMRSKRYAAELYAAGADPVHLLAVAFDGKRAWVQSGTSEGVTKAAPRKKPARRPRG